jgi:DNA-binding response OmpR family regulator
MCCQTDQFRVRSVSTLDALQQELDEALRGESKIDLLILDPVLVNGSAQPALRQWSKWYSNPMIIITSDRLSSKDREELFLQGAWSILDYSASYNVLGRQVRRFGRFIQNERRTTHLEKEVVVLRRYVIVLLVATAAALGEGIIPWVVNTFTTLLGG